MNRLHGTLGSATLAVAALGGILAAQQPVAKAPVLVTGARILDVEQGRYLPPAAIFVKDGRIANVAPQPPASLPAGATQVKADGAVVVPGLFDAHAWAAPTGDLDADYFYLMALAHGVTGVRVLNVRTNWGVSQRDRAASGAILAPRIWTSGRGINRGASPDRWLFDAPSTASAGDEVARQSAAKVNWIAGYDAIGPDIYAAIVEGARRSGVRVSGMPGASSMADLASAGVSSIETLAWPIKAGPGSADTAWPTASPDILSTLLSRLVRERVTLVPLMAAARARAFPEEASKDPSLALLPDGRRAAFVAGLAKLPKADVAAARRSWTSQAAFLRQFVRAGGKVAAGTGFDLGGYPVPGAGLHTELAALVRAGLTQGEALRAATVTPAELVGAKQGVTSFTPGTEANFIIVSGDPLKQIGDLARITTVVRAGEVLDPKDLLARARRTVGPASK